MIAVHPLQRSDIPYHLFRDQPEGEGDVLISDEDFPDEEKGRKLVCAGCGQVITDRARKISKGGTHRHTFFNPAGLVYELGCFSHAPGCSAAGESSSEFSWFAGYIWRVGVCRNCLAHIGWQFQSGDDSFYGLILTRLTESDG